MRPAPRFLYIALIFLVSSRDFCRADKVEDFKQYLANQPTVSNAVFSYVRPSEFKPPKDLPLGGEVVNRPVRHYQAGKSGSNYFLKEISSLSQTNNLSSFTMFCGRDDLGPFEVSRNALTRVN